jgi:sporulation protein YlmC with PRC-barrel domain
MEPFNIDNMTGQNNSGSRPNEPLKHLTASSLIGDNIFNPAGETLGKIKDIMIDITEARIAYVIIEFGGFLGINQKLFAVPMQALQVAKEHTNAFILNETKESLKNYPGFDKEHWPETNSHGVDPPGTINEGLMGWQSKSNHENS